MVTPLTLTKIGTSTGAETAEGYLLTAYELAMKQEMKAGREIMKDYCDTFKELAK